jgi:hypothetical protein
MMSIYSNLGVFSIDLQFYPLVLRLFRVVGDFDKGALCRSK